MKNEQITAIYTRHNSHNPNDGSSAKSIRVTYSIFAGDIVRIQKTKLQQSDVLNHLLIEPALNAGPVPLACITACVWLWCDERVPNKNAKSPAHTPARLFIKTIHPSLKGDAQEGYGVGVHGEGKGALGVVRLLPRGTLPYADLPYPRRTKAEGQKIQKGRQKNGEEYGVNVVRAANATQTHRSNSFSTPFLFE